MAIAIEDSTQYLHFDISNGLPSNHVYHMVQDKFGYIWMATDNGVVRYDGYEFKVFNTNSGLPKNDIWKLFADSKGRVWLFSYDYSVGYIEDERYVSIYNDENIIRLSRIFEKNDTVYVSFFTNENERIESLKFQIAKVKDVVKSITVFPRKFQWLSMIQISPDTILAINVNNAFYKGMVNNNFWKQEGVCKEVMQHLITTANYSSIDDKNNMFVSSMNGRVIHKINIENCKIEVYPISRFIDKAELSTGLNKGVNDESIFIMDLIKGVRGDTIEVKTNKRIYYLDENMNLLNKISYPSFLEDRTVTYYFKDIYGHEWFTTENAGVWVRPAGLKFEKSAKEAYLKNAHYLGCFLGNTYWSSASGSMIYELNAQNRRRVFTLPENLSVKSITVKNDSVLYVCSNQNIYLLNLFTSQVTEFSQGKKVFLDTINGDNRLQRGVTAERNKETRFYGHSKVHTYRNDTMLSLNSLYIDQFVFRQDTIFCTMILWGRFDDLTYDSYSQTYLFYNSRKINIYKPQTRELIEINSTELKRLRIDEVKNIISSGNGYIYIYNGQKITVYDLIHNRIYYPNLGIKLKDAIVKLYNGYLIAAGGFGFAYATVNGPKIDKPNIVPNIGNTYYSQVYDLDGNSKGTVLLNTNNGMYEFPMFEILKDEELAIKRSKENFKWIIRVPDRRHFSGRDTFTISRQTEKINIDFINYRSYGNLKYYYKFTGDNSWREANVGDIFLNTLSAGHYYGLQVYAEDDYWKTDVISFYVYIKPYWYQTKTWKNIFWISGVVLFLGFILLVIYVTRRITQQATEKKQSLADLELRALYAQINPHFIFNTLSASMFFISNGRLDDAYRHVSKFSRLLRSYLKSSRNRYTILSEEIQMLRNYLELQQIRFEEKFSYSIEVDNKIPADSLQIPSLLLQPLVENAINHGLFHSKEKGYIDIKFLQGESSDELICIIEDNGVGRARAKEINKSNPTKRESYGTQLTRELINIFEKYERMNIFLEYTDKKGLETGTIVKLTIRNLKYAT